MGESPDGLRRASYRKPRNVAPWIKAFQVVIPAKAGIQTALLSEEALMDSLSFPRRRELRGNDEIMGLCASLNCIGHGERQY